MSTTDYLVIALAVLLYVAFTALRRSIRYQNSAIEKLLEATNQGSETLEDLKKQIERVELKLDEVELKLDEIEYRSLSKTEKECRTFDGAVDLTVSNLRATKPGEKLRLIEKSYFYPSETPCLERFEYKHDHVDEESSSKFGYEIHGFRRSSTEDDWAPFQFLASEETAQTRSCAGTIRRL